MTLEKSPDQTTGAVFETERNGQSLPLNHFLFFCRPPFSGGKNKKCTAAVSLSNRFLRAERIAGGVTARVGAGWRDACARSPPND